MAKMVLSFKHVKEWPTELQVDWIWEGYLARGYVSILGGHPKAGKSTLAAFLLSNLTNGAEDFITPMQRTRALIVTEEHEALWGMRAKSLGIKDNLFMLSQPFSGTPTVQEWADLMKDIVVFTRQHSISLVVLDTFAALSPSFDENNADEMKLAFNPIRILASDGLSILMTHHMRKSGGTHGRGFRGSSALTGMADILIDINRTSEESPRDRTISAMGRFAGITPATIVITLDKDNHRFTVFGERYGTSQLPDRIEQARALLPKTEPGFSIQQITDLLPYGATTVRNILDNGVELGLVRVSGGGGRNDPKRYCTS